MRQLSATEAIVPAWDHTRDLLFAPRSWRVLLKVGLVALFAHIGGCNSNLNSFSRHHTPGVSPALASSFLLVGLVIAVFGLALAFVFFYLASRLQFVLFEIVLRRDTVVAPIWGRYGRATWFWMGLKALFMLVACLCALPFLVPSILHFIHVFPTLTAADPQVFSAGGPQVFHHFLHIFKEIFLLMIPFVVAAFVISLAYRLLYDFGMPSMALEGTPLGETVARVFRLMRAEPGQVALYVIVYVLLRLAMGIAYIVCGFLALVIALIPIGGLGAGLWYGLRHAGIPGYIFIGIGWAVLGLVLVAVMIAVVLTMIGAIYTFTQAYALYFLGGRYPLLGEYLEPTPRPIVPVVEVVYPAMGEPEAGY